MNHFLSKYVALMNPCMPGRNISNDWSHVYLHQMAVAVLRCSCIFIIIKSIFVSGKQTTYCRGPTFL